MTTFIIATLTFLFWNIIFNSPILYIPSLAIFIFYIWFKIGEYGIRLYNKKGDTSYCMTDCKFGIIILICYIEDYGFPFEFQCPIVFDKSDNDDDQPASDSKEL